MTTEQLNVRVPKITKAQINELAQDYGSQAKVIIAAVENLHTKNVELRGRIKMAYTICYHTGAGNFEFDGDLNEAMGAADKGAAYTQQSITIEDGNGEEVARRQWYGVEPDEEEGADIIQFGSYGYYGEWQES